MKSKEAMFMLDSPTLYLDHVIVEYDGPLLFTCKSKDNETYLGTCSIKRGDDRFWVFVKITENRLIGLLKDEITLYDVFKDSEDGKALLVKQNEETLTETGTILSSSELDDDLLPTKGEYLELDHDDEWYKDMERTTKGETIADEQINKWADEAEAGYDIRAFHGEFQVLSWDEYFMGIAKLSAMRSKDPSTRVGACIVNAKKRIVGIGYNGFPTGCQDEHFPWEREGELLETKYPYVVHAELNAILNSKGDLEGSSLYVTLFPCNECAKAIIQSGIKRVVYESDKYHYSDDAKASRRMFDASGIIYEEAPSDVLVGVVIRKKEKER